MKSEDSGDGERLFQAVLNKLILIFISNIKELLATGYFPFLTMILPKKRI